MKNRTNQMLLAAAIVTAALYALFLLGWLEMIPISIPSSLGGFLGAGFHAVPCFCLQLLVCRVAKRPVVRLIPVFLLVGIAAAFFAAMANSTGWDGLGWAFLLLLCFAPAVGYGTAWVVYGVQRARQKRFT